jgi:hypothetical protein
MPSQADSSWLGSAFSSVSVVPPFDDVDHSGLLYAPQNLHVVASGGSGSGQQGRRASSVSSSPTRGGEDRSGSPPLPGAWQHTNLRA